MEIDASSAPPRRAWHESPDAQPPAPPTAAPRARPRGFVRICWIVTLLAACGAAFQLFDVFVRGGLSAPQQAAGAALACALCVIPYVFTRAIEGLS